MDLTKEQYEKLKPCEDILSKAAHNRTVLKSEMAVVKQELAFAYRELTGKDPGWVCGGCGGRIEWLYRLGIWYEKAKKSYDGKE